MRTMHLRLGFGEIIEGLALRRAGTSTALNSFSTLLLGSVLKNENLPQWSTFFVLSRSDGVLLSTIGRALERG